MNGHGAGSSRIAAQRRRPHEISEPAEFGRVAVIYGGLGAEREVSLNMGVRVLEALQSRGVDAHGIDAGRDLVAVLAAGGFDRVCIMLPGTGGEDGRLQGALEWLELPYTGSGVLGSALSMDKLRCKQIWRSLGLATPQFVALRDADDCALALAELGLPLIVKPAREGSSVGMTKVSGAEQLAGAYAAARRYDACVIAERWIDNGEYTVAILGDGTLPVIKVETPREFYDYDAKYIADDTRYLIPSGLDADAERALGELALRAFRAIDGYGWGRADFLRDAGGSFHLLEVNTVPGMTDHSLVPKAALAAGVDFETLCWRILETSFVERSAPSAPAPVVEVKP